MFHLLRLSVLDAWSGFTLCVTAICAVGGLFCLCRVGVSLASVLSCFALSLWLLVSLSCVFCLLVCVRSLGLLVALCLFSGVVSDLRVLCFVLLPGLSCVLGACRVYHIL